MGIKLFETAYTKVQIVEVYTCEWGLFFCYSTVIGASRRIKTTFWCIILPKSEHKPGVLLNTQI